jgi:hypothetical protein
MNKLLAYGLPLLAFLCITLIIFLYGPWVLEGSGFPASPRDGGTQIALAVLTYLVSCLFLLSLLLSKFRALVFIRELLGIKIMYCSLGVVILYVVWATYILIMLSRSTDF